jgi:hypothetical protein
MNTPLPPHSPLSLQAQLKTFPAFLFSVLNGTRDDATDIGLGCFQGCSMLLLVGSGFWILCQDMSEFCYIRDAYKIQA